MKNTTASLKREMESKFAQIADKVETLIRLSNTDGMQRQLDALVESIGNIKAQID